MAVYTPTNLIPSKAMGNGSGNIATWQRQCTAGAGGSDIHRTTSIVTPTAARTVTVESGSVATATTAQRIIDAYALTANVEYVRNWWKVVENSSYFQGYANAADINAETSGYVFA